MNIEIAVNQARLVPQSVHVGISRSCTVGGAVRAPVVAKVVLDPL